MGVLSTEDARAARAAIAGAVKVTPLDPARTSSVAIRPVRSGHEPSTGVSGK
jgi:hypothetical protein